MRDHIEKSVELKAPVARVWRALTDHQEFGEWFRVKLDGPFVPGEVTTGQVTYPGYEHLKWRAEVQAMEPERLFSFTWHPGAVEPELDHSTEPQTLVEFRLQPIPGGTRLELRESGFSALPEGRREEDLRRNEGGWEQQMENIKAHVSG